MAGNVGFFVLRFNLSEALCLYVRGGGSGDLYGMGQSCCQCYKLAINAKSLKRGHGGWLMRQGTGVGGHTACSAGAPAGPTSRARRSPAGTDGWLCGGCLETGAGPGQAQSNFFLIKTRPALQGREAAAKCPAPALGQPGGFSSRETIAAWVGMSHPCIWESGRC